MSDADAAHDNFDPALCTACREHDRKVAAWYEAPSSPGAAAGEPTDAELLDHIALEYGYRVTEAVDEEMAANARHVAQRLKFLAAALRSASPVAAATPPGVAAYTALRAAVAAPTEVERDAILDAMNEGFARDRAIVPVHEAMRRRAEAAESDWQVAVDALRRMLAVVDGSPGAVETGNAVAHARAVVFDAAVAAPGAGGKPND
jgi:hypothetical protein